MIKWPQNKKFAFTIVDDTDKVSVQNVKPVYEYLYKSGIITTKTVWGLGSRDQYGGQSLSDNEYKEFIKDLSNKGYEIAFHGAGSGDFNREEVLQSLNLINEVVGYYPTLHANHAHNSDNLYWGSKRFSFPINYIYNFIRMVTKRKNIVSLGDKENSHAFWGDFSKKNIKYIRNRVYSGLNTIEVDKYMPYKEKSKEKFSNYWFSSSDAYDCNAFIKLLSKENIDKLVDENGCAIIYTHFAYGFVDENGNLNEEFKNCIDYLSNQNGWFAPATKILDFIKSKRNIEYISNIKSLYLDIIWFKERLIRKIFGGI